MTRNRRGARAMEDRTEARCSFAAGLTFSGALLLILALCAGCHSRFVDATIDNRGAKAIQMIEVDYPSASFGVGSLAPGAQFHYRFKIQGSGAIKLQFTDAQGSVHDLDGPELQEGQEGRLTISIDSAGKVKWQSNLAGKP